MVSKFLDKPHVRHGKLIFFCQTGFLPLPLLPLSFQPLVMVQTMSQTLTRVSIAQRKMLALPSLTRDVASVAAQTLTMVQVGPLAVVTEFVGAVALGARVTSTIKNGIISIDRFEGSPGALMLAMGCAGGVHTTLMGPKALANSKQRSVVRSG